MFLSQQELEKIGLCRFGKNVQISSQAMIYRPEEVSLGDHVRIDDFCVLSGKITIGSYTHLAVGCNLLGEVVIGNFCNLSYQTLVLARSDDFSGEFLAGPVVPDELRRVQQEPVTIDDHCILGARTTVLPGVTVAEGTATGAHTLLNRSTDPWKIYLGTPARPFQERSSACTSLTTHLK